MSTKMHVLEGKILRITNSLVRDIPLNSAMDEKQSTYLMESYIKSEGWRVKGPIITHNFSNLNMDDERPAVRSQIIFQLHEPVLRSEPPYVFVPVIRSPPCLYVRFSGHPEKLSFAYAKLGLHAYENDMTLSGESYLVLVDQTIGKTIIDIFMPVQKEEATYETISPE